METLPQQPEILARSLQVAAPVDLDRVPGRAAEHRSPPLRLVAGATLTLAQPSPDAMPQGWQSALMQLARWLDLDVTQVPHRAASGLQRVTGWATGAPPVFVPWQCWSPISLQHPGTAALPRAHWVASYLFDQGTGKPASRKAVDIQLMSPLPAACLPDLGADAMMPTPDVLQAMICAARSEGRDKIAIVTDVRRRNAMIRRLLLLDRIITRGGPDIEVVTIENALCEVVQGRPCWDAIIVLPDLRSLMFAMLAQVHNVQSPWPMLWHHRDVVMVCAETLDEHAGDLPLNAPLLVQALALTAKAGGLSRVAQRLVQGAARLWDCNMVTPGRGSVAPYVTEISDREFVDHLCRGVPGGQRTTPRWRAVAAHPALAAPRRTARLSVVPSGEGC